MRRKILYLLVMVLLLVACSKTEPELSSIGKEDEEYLMEDDLGSYVDEVSYEIGKKIENEDYDYSINFIIKAKDSFDQLENREKLGLMGAFYQGYLHEGYVNCGSPECSWGNIVIKTSNNAYVSDGYSMITNGKNKYTWEELREGNGKLADQAEASKRANESKTNGVSNDIIYKYMKSAYDDLTDNGANYIPEVHDPLVDEMAAQRFGITEAQANEIYIKREMEKY
ncbi:hypothetical protein [Guptibacillus spartinae]|uniref:hypothetical protein n=1 Tax=Guptibacillus spartinae TaxID=3025679 RepID=UPI002360D82B|nr:hypothetical protein [Pseudalkalibacillus spartinae]